jgi:S1-C subfamily serine protease
MDRSLDVAALGKKFRLELPRSIAVFDYPLGRARELEWGSFVYVFGYPMGNKMVTKGTVSSPNKDKHGSFLMDAVFNRGFSGGVVVAIRDGVPNFELVGMVKLVSASSEYVLAPSEESGAVGYDPREPYTGTIHAVNKLTINYGITQAISVEAITGFLRAEQTLIERNGYSLGRFGALQPDVQ